jgi:hypothetical protein
MGSPISISPTDLYGCIGTAPVVLDVRRTASFEADETVIICTPRREHARLAPVITLKRRRMT